MNKNILNIALIASLLGGLGFSASPAQATSQPGEKQSFSCSTVTEIPQKECEALMALYNSTNGDSWTNHTNWLTNPTPSTWYGVGVFTDSKVGQIVGTLDLSQNKLSGSLPSQMGDLTHLVELDLYHNQLSGPIPSQLGNLAALWNLSLSSNQLSGAIPPELGNLKKLSHLYLSSNQLSGDLPENLFTLPDLVFFSLSENLFSGPIPTGLANLSKLWELDLSSNQFSGAIPPELGNLTSLGKLYLQINQLSGAIPGELGGLTNLQELFLGVNQLSGSFPPELFNLVQLTDLNLVYNQLSGPLPPAIGNLTNLTHFRIQQNDLSGDLPLELTNLIHLVNATGLDIGYNHFNVSVSDPLTSFLLLKDPDWASTQTPPPLPGAFAKISPTNLTTSVPVSPTLTWESSPIATSYEYCIDTLNNNACDAAWISTGLKPSAMPGGLSVHSIYFWQVRARNGNGTSVANGGTWWTFTTESVDSTRPQIYVITPTEAIQGHPFWIEIQGAGFQIGAAVRINNQSYPASIESSTHLRVSIPATLPAGTFGVAVVNPNNQSDTLTDALTILDAALPDLYAPDDYLFSDHVLEYAGQSSHLTLNFQRAGGLGPLVNISVAFYAKPNGGNLISLGEISVASIADGQWRSAAIGWTPALAGTYEISAVIDPHNTIGESNETNNEIKAWAFVIQAAPLDSIPPPIASFLVDGGSQANTSGSADLELYAPDPQPGSGTTWAYFQTWEFFANLNAWYPVDASGWMPYAEGSPNHYSYGYSAWPGPRIIGAWAADRAKNITPQASTALVNYIAPIDVLFQGESRWYLFYLAAGQSLNMSAQPGVDSDVDLYIWPSDYPNHPVVASVQDGPSVEMLNYSAPANGYYWVEVYGYTTGSYYLTVNHSSQSLPTLPSASSTGALAVKPVHTPGITLNNLPPKQIRLVPIRKSFIPIVVR